MKPYLINNDISFIVDKALRRAVCIKIANVFENNKFNRAEARELALMIEEKIRKMDPTMTKRYKLCFRKMIKEVKNISHTVYQQLNEHFIKAKG